MSSMVESELSSSTLCPMEQSTSSLPRLAMAPTADGCHSPMDTGCDEINQAWFTTKEDKDSLQGKGAYIYLHSDSHWVMMMVWCDDAVMIV